MNKVIGVRCLKAGQTKYVFTNDESQKNDWLFVTVDSKNYLYQAITKPTNYNKSFHYLLTENPAKQAKSQELKQYLKILEQTDDYERILQDIFRKLKINATYLKVLLDLEETQLKVYYQVGKIIVFKDILNLFFQRIKKKIAIHFDQLSYTEEFLLNGGLGICFEEVCCHRKKEILPDPNIEFAKYLKYRKVSSQNSLGSCNRVMCCILNEDEAILNFFKNMPEITELLEYKNNEYYVEKYDLEKKEVYLIDKETQRSQIYPFHQIMLYQQTKGKK